MHPDWWTIGLQTFNFAILVWLLHRFLYKPVLEMIDARKAGIRRQLDNAKAVEEKAKAELAAVDKARVEIAKEREAAIKAAAAQAQGIVETRRAQAERDADALMTATRKTLDAEREHVLDEAQRLALDLGAGIAQKLLAEMPVVYRAEAWIDRIAHHLDALSQAERDALVQQLNGNALKVVTACALPPETADIWKTRLRQSLGAVKDITFEENPELIAGAELFFPTAILRFSWQSVLDNARTEVGIHGRSG